MIIFLHSEKMCDVHYAQMHSQFVNYLSSFSGISTEKARGCLSVCLVTVLLFLFLPKPSCSDILRDTEFYQVNGLCISMRDSTILSIAFTLQNQCRFSPGRVLHPHQVWKEKSCKSELSSAFAFASRCLYCTSNLQTEEGNSTPALLTSPFLLYNGYRTLAFLFKQLDFYASTKSTHQPKKHFNYFAPPTYIFQQFLSPLLTSWLWCPLLISAILPWLSQPLLKANLPPTP